MKQTLIKTAVISIIILFNLPASAQMECRSMLGAHLTPFKKDGGVLWAVEGTMAPGVMTSPYDSLGNAQLNGGMLLGALDFKLGNQKNHFYVEGGFKNWKNSALVDDNFSSKGNSRHLGVRQAFYSYTGKNTKIKLGLHETKLGDFFLIDERVLGTSIDHSTGAFTFNFRAATVLKNFARMGNFCANRHLYGVLNPDYTENIGKHLGETNLTGIAINWNPHYKKPAEESADTSSNDEFSSDDEFSNEDEFHEDHDFSNTPDNGDEFSDNSESKTKSQTITLTNVGIIAYDEYGSIIANNKFYGGVLLDFKLPFNLFFQTGAVSQTMLHNNSVAYITRFGKTIIWDNTANTKISGAFIGKYDLDENALFQPLFSNLFIGEVMRMDAVNFPLWQFAVKHRFPGKLKFHIATKFAGMLENGKTNEQDLEAGSIILKHHLKITLIGSRIETQLLPKTFYMGRLEMRLSF